MNYGLPYKGSKNKIAEWVVSYLPAADTLVDLFAGGCAITHAALKTKKYKNYIVNDMSDAPALFVDAVQGKYADERRWISRETFAAESAADPYIRYCWSFGNNGSSYMYSQEIEAWKRALWYARVLGDCAPLREFGIDSDGSVADVKAHATEYRDKYVRWWLERHDYTTDDVATLLAQAKEKVRESSDRLREYLLNALRASGLTQAEVQRRLGTQMAGHYFGRSQWEFPTEFYYNKMREFMPALDRDYYAVYGLHELFQRLQRLQSLQRLQRLQSLQSLQSLQRLQSLESLESLESLQRLQSDYRSVELPPNCVVYCDIPYYGTCGYNGAEFDHAAFYDWAERQSVPIFISEYYMPPERFKCIAEIGKVCNYSAKGGLSTTERLFVPLHQRCGGYKQLQFDF